MDYETWKKEVSTFLSWVKEDAFGFKTSVGENGKQFLKKYGVVFVQSTKVI